MAAGILSVVANLAGALAWGFHKFLYRQTPRSTLSKDEIGLHTSEADIAQKPVLERRLETAEATALKASEDLEAAIDVLRHLAERQRILDQAARSRTESALDRLHRRLSEMEFRIDTMCKDCKRRDSALVALETRVRTLGEEDVFMTKRSAEADPTLAAIDRTGRIAVSISAQCERDK